MGEVPRKASGMRGELWTPRNAVECSEIARLQEGDVAKPPDALGCYVRLRKRIGSMETKKAMGTCKPGENV